MNMKPKLEDVLFLKKECKHKPENKNGNSSKTSNTGHKSVCPLVKTTQENLENLVKEELKNKYYPGFVKYFKVNKEECELKRVKNVKKSVEARVKGSSLFAKNEHDVDIHMEIWKLYCTSIALAPAESKELVLAYECRSNLLLHFKQYEDCIKDIDRAFSLTQLDLLKVKLLCRKMTCFVAMNKTVAEKKSVWKDMIQHLKKVRSVFKDEKFSKMVEQAKNDANIQPDKKIKKEENFENLTVAIIHDKEKNIVADRDYKVGETIIVSKHTITSVNPNKFYAYCSHCLSFMWAGIPCDECSLSMYCSENCKKAAWNKYHSVECKVNPHIDFSYSVYYELSAGLKIFLIGVREFGSLAKLLEVVREIEQLRYDNNFAMKFHEKFPASEFLIHFVLPYPVFITSCSLSYHLKNTCLLMAYLTQILECMFEKEVGTMKGKDLAKDDDFVYSTVIMFRLVMLCSMHMNYPVAREKSCLKNKSPSTCIFKRCCSPGSIFYYFNGLIEKSCDPNVSFCETKDGKIVYYSIKPIKSREILTIACTIPFYYKNKEERSLMKPYSPDFCQCKACEENWPPILLQGDDRLKDLTATNEKIITKHALRLHNQSDENLLNITLEELEEFGRDTHKIVSECGQPSCASSWMIFTFDLTFKRLHGDVPMRSRIPKDC